MARNKDDRLKRALLLCFVMISVALIVTMYVTELTVGSEPAPAFYRGAPTIEPSIQQTITAPPAEPHGLENAAETPPSSSDSTPDYRTLIDG